jgi:hypothetical protein
MSKSMLDKIRQARAEFIPAKGTFPTTIYMTESEMKQLRSEMKAHQICTRRRDLKQRMRPDLLPPLQRVPPIHAGCMILGMTIAETDTPGLHLERQS